MWIILALMYPTITFVLGLVMRLELLEPGLQYINGAQLFLFVIDVGALLLTILVPQILLLAMTHVFFLNGETPKATWSLLSRFGKSLLVASPLVFLSGVLFAGDGWPTQMLMLCVLGGVVLGLLICWLCLLIDASIFMCRSWSWRHCVAFVVSVLGILIFVLSVVVLIVTSGQLFDRNHAQLFFEADNASFWAVGPIFIQHLYWILGHPETASFFPLALLFAFALGTVVWLVARLLDNLRS